MGSAAFLVSACRYLSERVVVAWERDGYPDTVLDALGSGFDRDDALLEARRIVAARCLYGVDRDDAAVELGKLSLWLVTLAKDKPFSFLDHALRHGDSLVGLTSESQVTAFHLDPATGHAINARMEGAIDEIAEPIMASVKELRQEIAKDPVQRRLDGRRADREAGRGRQADRETPHRRRRRGRRRPVHGRSVRGRLRRPPHRDIRRRAAPPARPTASPRWSRPSARS